MDLQKFKEHVFSCMRYEKKNLSEKRPTIEFKLRISNRFGGGKPNRYVFEFYNKEFEAEDCSLGAIRDISRVLDICCKELNEMRGYQVRPIAGKFYYEGRDVFGRTTMSQDYTEGLILCSKPCKEFEAMRRIIERHVNVRLLDLDLYEVDIVGKRGTNYRESGRRHYYAYDPRKCNAILGWIRLHKSASDKMSCTIVEENDCEDEEHSRYYETESYGTRHRMLNIQIFGKGNTHKAQLNTMYI